MDRIITCKLCGRKGSESDFWTYGGVGNERNMGKCYDCDNEKKAIIDYKKKYSEKL